MLKTSIKTTPTTKLKISRLNLEELFKTQAPTSTKSFTSVKPVTNNILNMLATSDICILWEFNNWLATFVKKDLSWWWINSENKILADWFGFCYDFSEWFAWFERNWLEWWIKSDWTILAEWFDMCHYFDNWLARFKRVDSTWWLMKSDGTILVDWLAKFEDLNPYLIKK